MSISFIDFVQLTRIKNIFDKHTIKIMELDKIIEFKLGFLIFLNSSKVEEDNKIIINDIPNIPAIGINPFIRELSIEA